MPTPPTRQPAARRLSAFSGQGAGGFTLLEVLAVLVIVGIILTFVTLNAGGDKRAEQMEREAQRLAALLQLASDEAVMRGEQLAVRIEENAYSFMMLHNNQWLPIEDDDTLRARTLPDGIEFKLELEENPPPGLTAEEADQPQVFLLSSGEMTPFELILSTPDSERAYRLKGTLLGRLELE